MYALARLLVARGDLDGAAIALESIMNEHATFMPAYTDLAVILVNRNRLDLAETVLKRGLDVSKDDPLLHNDLGVIKVLQVNYKDALLEFERAAALSPSDPRFHANHALALALLGQYDASMAMYERVLPTADAHHNVNVIRRMVEARNAGTPIPDTELQTLMGVTPERDVDTITQAAPDLPVSAVEGRQRALVKSEAPSAEQAVVVPEPPVQTAPKETVETRAPAKASAVEQPPPQVAKPDQRVVPSPAASPVLIPMETVETTRPAASSVQPRRPTEVTESQASLPPTSQQNTPVESSRAVNPQSIGNRGYITRNSVEVVEPDRSAKQANAIIPPEPNPEEPNAQESAITADPVPEESETQSTDAKPILLAQNSTDETPEPSLTSEIVATPPEPKVVQQSGLPRVVDAVDASHLSGYTVQVASFEHQDRARAERFKKNFEAESEFDVTLSKSEDATLIRATVGNFRDYKSAAAVQRLIAAKEEYKDCFVRKAEE
jgi:hypothetical protein